MEIRTARITEAGLLRRIVQRAYRGYVARIGRRPAPMDDDYDLRVRSGQVSVAVVGGDVAGLIVTAARPDHLLVENVAVDPAHQGRGVGRALLEHAEHLAARDGLPELRLYTNAAMTENLALYPRLGYTEIGRQRSDGFDRVFFVKPLAAPGERRPSTPPDLP